jgi:hypothetical protein
MKDEKQIHRFPQITQIRTEEGKLTLNWADENGAKPVNSTA